MHYYRSRLKARGMQQKGVILGDSLVVSNVDDLLHATFKVSNPADRERLGGMMQRAFSAMGVNKAAEFYFQNGFDQGRLGSFQVVPCEKYEPNRTLLLLCSLHLSVDDYAPVREGCCSTSRAAVTPLTEISMRPIETAWRVTWMAKHKA